MALMLHRLPRRASTIFATAVWLAIALCMTCSSPLNAQSKKFGQADEAGDGFGNLGLPSVGKSSPMSGLAGSSQASIEFEGTYQLEKGTRQGRLVLQATIADGYHTYSTTQPPGGPYPTEFELESGPVQLQGNGAFVADHDPTIGYDQLAYGDLPLEEYHEAVSWTAPIEASQDFDPAGTSLTVDVNALVCRDGACEPFRATVTANFGGYYETSPTTTSLRVDRTHAVWTAQITPAQVRPGESATLELTATNDDEYHVYEYVPGDEETVFRTLIVATRKSGMKLGTPSTNAHLETYPGLDDVKYYGGVVTWKIPVQVPASLAAGEYPLGLSVGFVTCNETSCDERSAIDITGAITVGDKRSGEPRAFELSSSDFASVADQPMLASWIDDSENLPLADNSQSSLAAAAEAETQGLTLVHILAGLAGGFILNFMPCVLPVIGLKVMSFVNQAGNSHRRVVALNLSYVGGILAVMLILALFTVAAKLLWGNAFGWGEQFTVLEFKVALACLVFAMALSFLGVWEIPIPGFATSSTSGELMQKEGATGAFLKGVLTTILATPCSGPLLGSLFGLSLVLSPLSVVVLYLVVGLGMALPFLVLCLYPGFIKMLPKPGAWMETLKQALAFPLLLTAVFFVASIDSDHRIATLILLVVVWFACWLIGRVPSYADAAKLRNTWVTAIGIIGVGTVISFTYFGPLNSELKWVPYSEAQLAKLRGEGRTVMIDFTANWCLNCQINTRVAIDRAGVARLVEENQVIPMLADWTDPSDEIRAKLDELQSNSIPLLVIYPAEPGAEPIVLRDLLTEAQVIEALESAGPSQPTSKLASVIH